MNVEYRTAEYRRKVSLRSFFIIKIDRIHSFDIRNSTFDILRFCFIKVTYGVFNK